MIPNSGNLGLINQGYHLDREGFKSLAAWIKLPYQIVVDQHFPLDFEPKYLRRLHVVDDGSEWDQNTVIRIDTPSISDFERLGPRVQNLITMTHRDITDSVVVESKKRGLALYSLDESLLPDNRRSIECFEITGECGAKCGVEALSEKPQRIVVLGFGNCAKGACSWLHRNGFSFEVINRLTTKDEIRNIISDVDLLINGINWPMDRRGQEYLLEQKHVESMKKGSVIVDLDVDYLGMGPIETCRATYPDEVFYTECGVRHACLWGWPILDPQKSGHRYWKQIGMSLFCGLIPKVV